MRILAIETTTQVRSVAVCDNDRLLSEIYQDTALQHSAQLIPMVRELLTSTACALDSIDLIAVAQGPGSFTSVRVGISTAKTLAYMLEKPIVGISSLEATAYPLTLLGLAAAVMLDAKKREVYFAAYQPSATHELLETIKPLTLPATDLALSGLEQYVFVGNALPIYGERIRQQLPTVRFADPLFWYPRAATVALLCYRRLQAGTLAPVADFASLAQFAPVYLRRPDAEINWEKLHGCEVEGG